MSTPNQVFLRDYSKIYTGTNQEGGSYNPFLGFTTDTTAVTLKADKSAYFHYPNTAEQMYLSATDLIESGAFAGSMPYKSDKIFKKQADYKNDTPYGNATPENLQKGIWLCAWLSGNDAKPTQTPVWMDRWYKPGYLDSTQSLFVCSTSAVYDEPSSLTFDPGVWYRYDHVGSNANSQMVGLICALSVHIDYWEPTSIDITGNENNAILQNYTETMITEGVNPTETATDNGLHLNGINQYGSILYDTTFDVSNDLTCNVWIKSDDWQNQPSHHLISNGLRGGWHLGFNNGFFTPLNILIGSNGNVIFNNQTGNFYKDMALPGSSCPVGFGIDSELYIWILDNGTYTGSKHLYKMDYNGNIDSAVSFASSINLCDMVIDGDNLIWVTNGTIVSAFNPFCELVCTSNKVGGKLVINSMNILSAFNATDACVFEDVHYWTISGGDLYWNGDLMFAGLSATNIQCTKDCIWALYDTNKILQINKETTQLTNEVTFIPGISSHISDTISSSVTGRNIFFTNEFANGFNNDYIWVLQPDTGYLYKYDTELNLKQKINTIYVKNSIQSSAVKGDASGYQWHRKFNYGYLTMPQIEAVAYLGTGSPLVSGQKYKTTIPVSALSVNDWHMFTFSIDSLNSNLNLYMDTILRDTEPITTSSIFYKYETPLLIGTNIGHINPLDEEINKINKIYHLGAFDDLRIYTNPLNNSDIRHIYLTKFDFNDLVWNMPTGVQSYVEEIVSFFKFKMPGQKSQYYNIHLRGLQIQDESVRQIIEDIIKNSIQKIAPLYTSLYKIIWE